MQHKKSALNIYYNMQSTFLDLRCKEVVNIIDGRKLGHIVDIVIDLPSACVVGLVVPGEQCFWNLLRPVDPLFISWQQITKIGEDTIFVELTSCAPSPPFPYRK